MKTQKISQESIRKAHEAMQKILEERELKKIEKLNEITTEEAFQHLLTSKALWKKTGIASNKQRVFRHIKKTGKPISLKKKFELLKKAGFTQTLTWKLSEK